VTSELCGSVFFEFPVRYATRAAGTIEPFVSEPPCSATVSGVVGHERFVAVGCDTGLVTHDFDGLDTVKKAASGGPELYLFYQAEKFDPFAVKSFGWFFFLFHILQLYLLNIMTISSGHPQP
jgi:hypothetical protein